MMEEVSLDLSNHSRDVPDGSLSEVAEAEREVITVEFLASDEERGSDAVLSAAPKKPKPSAPKFPLATSNYSKPTAVIMAPSGRKRSRKGKPQKSVTVPVNVDIYGTGDDDEDNVAHMEDYPDPPSSGLNFTGVPSERVPDATTGRREETQASRLNKTLIVRERPTSILPETYGTSKSRRHVKPPVRYIDVQASYNMGRLNIGSAILERALFDDDGWHYDRVTPHACGRNEPVPMEVLPAKRQRTRQSHSFRIDGADSYPVALNLSTNRAAGYDGHSRLEMNNMPAAAALWNLSMCAEASGVRFDGNGPSVSKRPFSRRRTKGRGSTRGRGRGRGASRIDNKETPKSMLMEVLGSPDESLGSLDGSGSLGQNVANEAEDLTKRHIDNIPNALRGRGRRGRRTRKPNTVNDVSTAKTERSKPEEPTVCSLCSKEFKTVQQFKRHNYVEHNGLARVAGNDEPISSTDERSIYYQCVRAVGKLRCPVPDCRRTFSSVGGFLYHSNICGKEVERAMVACELCGKMLYPASMKTHMKAYHPPTPPPEHKEGGLGKRKAARKALEKVSRIAQDIKHEGIDMSDEDYCLDALEESQCLDENKNAERKEKLYLEPEKIHVSKELYKEWKDELAKNGFVLCKNQGCIKAMNTMKTIRFHYQTCPNSTHGGLYTCIICQYSSSSRVKMNNHVAMHKGGVNGDVTNDELEYLYRVSMPANQTKKKGTRFSLGSSQIYQSIRIGEFDERLFAPHVEFATQFYGNNHFGKVFLGWQPATSGWKFLPSSESTQFLPVTAESMKFKNSFLAEGESESKDPKLKHLKLFESCSEDVASKLITCFTGGPIWACAWCPTLHTAACRQYVAVACHQEMDATFLCMKTHMTSGLVQLWDVGILEEGKDCVPKMCLGIAHRHGAVWSLVWCPSGCWDDPRSLKGKGHMPRLGLLAAACADGLVRIYSVPHPSILKTYRCLTDNDLPIYLATPVAILSLSKSSVEISSEVQCTTLSWHQGRGHQFIAGGYSNGLVAVWDLATKSPLLRLETSFKLERLFSFMTFRAHGTMVTGVDFSHVHDGRFLATVSRDRCIKFWDLEDISFPYNTLRRRIMTGVKWPPHWCGVYTYGDHCYNMVGNNASYVECGYFGEISMALASHNTCIWDASPSYWLNCLVSCDVAGEVVIAVISHLMQNSNYQKMSNHRRLPLYRIETVRKDDALQPTSHEMTAINLSIQNGSTATTVSTGTKKRGKGQNVNKTENKLNEFIRPMTYEETANVYHLHYKDAAVWNLKSIPLQELRHISSSTYMATGSVDEYPITSVNRVAWNPNLGSHVWIATGEQSGMLRLIYVKSLDKLSVDSVRNVLKTYADNSLGESSKGATNSEAIL